MKSTKRFFSLKAVCPRYKSEDKQMIYCEGVDENTALHLAFTAKDEMKSYMKVKCRKCWGECMIAQMLNRKYDY